MRSLSRLSDEEQFILLLACIVIVLLGVADILKIVVFGIRLVFYVVLKTIVGVLAPVTDMLNPLQ